MDAIEDAAAKLADELGVGRSNRGKPRRFTFEEAEVIRSATRRGVVAQRLADHFGVTRALISNVVGFRAGYEKDRERSGYPRVAPDVPGPGAGE